MNNKHSRITEDRRQELNNIMDEMVKNAYYQGYEDGKKVSELVVDNIVKHEGVKYKKVFRLAQEGDLVRFNNTHVENTHTGAITSGKLYKVITAYDEPRFNKDRGDGVYKVYEPSSLRTEDSVEVFEKLQQLRTPYQETLIHNGQVLKRVDRETKTGDFVRYGVTTNPNILKDKLYEVFDESKYVCEFGFTLDVYRWGKEMKSSLQVFEPVHIVTPNQQRKELIEKARKFVEENSIGTLFNNISFVINTNKRTVVALKSSKVVKSAKAKCDPDDVFNEYLGMAIALGRLQGLPIPREFLEAVQPSEVVVGHTVTTKNSLQIYDVPAFHERDFLNGEFGRAIAIEGLDSSSWIGEKQVFITNDTHAEY